MKDTAHNNSGANTRLDYTDQLAVWIAAIKLGIVGRVGKDAYDLLIDRDLAVIELNAACDVVVTLKSLRTIVDKFATMKVPYPSWEPPVSKAAITRTRTRSQKPTPMTAYELGQIGPHLRGLMDRPVASDAAA